MQITVRLKLMPSPNNKIPTKFVNSIKIPLSYLRLESPAAVTSVFLFGGLIPD